MPYTLEEFNMYSAAQAAVGSRSEHQGAVAPKQCLQNAFKNVLSDQMSWVPSKVTIAQI